MIMVLSLKRRRSINQANQLCYEYLKCDIKECVEQTKEQPTIDSNRYLIFDYSVEIHYHIFL